MAILKKSDILAVRDIETETVAVPEWGGEVLVSGLTGKERDEFEASVVEMRGKSTKVDMSNIRAKLCAIAIHDEEGKRMWDEDEVDELGKKSARALQRVFEVAQRLSGLSDGDVESLV